MTRDSKRDTYLDIKIEPSASHAEDLMEQPTDNTLYNSCLTRDDVYDAGQYRCVSPLPCQQPQQPSFLYVSSLHNYHVSFSLVLRKL